MRSMSKRRPKHLDRVLIYALTRIISSEHNKKISWWELSLGKAPFKPEKRGKWRESEVGRRSKNHRLRGLKLGIIFICPVMSFPI